MAKTAFFSHELFLKHQMGTDNPEDSSRIEKISELMVTSGIEDYVEQRQAVPVAYSDMLAAHDADYLTFLEQTSPSKGLVSINEDTKMNPFTWHAAQYAAGACCEAVKGVVTGEFQRAFCEVRPPGHHAHRNRSGGFCFLNNAAIATLYGINHYGLKRVAVVDFDVHHGDGTSDILGGREDVLILDIFQEGLYPYAHFRNCPSNAVYRPFPQGSEGEALRKTMDELWMPKLQEYQPELIILSAGFDAHRDEEQAQLLMVESDYAFLGRRFVVAMNSIKCCKGIVAILEGGYNNSALARSCMAFIAQLIQTD